MSRESTGAPCSFFKSAEIVLGRCQVAEPSARESPCTNRASDVRDDVIHVIADHARSRCGRSREFASPDCASKASHIAIHGNMFPAVISATSLLVFESCEVRH